jgi:hypothetical protein
MRNRDTKKVFIAFLLQGFYGRNPYRLIPGIS